MPRYRLSKASQAPLKTTIDEPRCRYNGSGAMHAAPHSAGRPENAGPANRPAGLIELQPHSDARYDQSRQPDRDEDVDEQSPIPERRHAMEMLEIVPCRNRRLIVMMIDFDVSDYRAGCQDRC
jgi:hypothetical protein